MLVNFRALSSRLSSTWRILQRIADEIVRDGIRNLAIQGQALLARSHLERTHELADTASDPELGLIDRQLARLDLREIEDIVNDRQQRICRILHDFEVFALLGIQFGRRESLQSCRECR